MSLPGFGPDLRDLVSSRLGSFPHRPRSVPDTHRAAAVAVVLIPGTTGDGVGPDPAFVLTRRTPRMGAHAGQWALPGGRLDHGEDAVDACLREVHEEIGLDLDRGAVLGRLDDYPTRSGYVITPLVLWGGEDVHLVPDPDEVAAVYRVPLSELAREPRFVTIPQSERPVVQVPLLGSLIHAPTGAILYQMREVVVFDRPTRVDHLEQPVFAWE